MFETLKNNVDIKTLLIFLGFLLVVGAPGLWYVRKTTGRSMRDMVTVLAAAVTLILLMLPAILVFKALLDSPNRTTHWLVENALVAALAIVAVAISWAFNKLAKHRAHRKKPKAQTEER